MSHEFLEHFKENETFSRPIISHFALHWNLSATDEEIETFQFARHVLYHFCMIEFILNSILQPKLMSNVIL